MEERWVLWHVCRWRVLRGVTYRGVWDSQVGTLRRPSDNPALLVMREVSAVTVAIGLFFGPPYLSCFEETTLLGSHGVVRNWPPHLYKQMFNQAVQSESSTLNHRDWFRCGHVTQAGPVNKEHIQALLDPPEKRRWCVSTRLMGWYLKPQSVRGPFFHQASLMEYQDAGCYQEVDWLMKRGCESPRVM